MLRSYTTFTRAERMGIICLGALLIILIGIRATMYLWVHPASDADQQKKLVAAWGVFKRSERKVTDTTTKSDYQDSFDEGETPLPQIIDINIADSATLVRLKGIGPVTAGKIVAYRKKNGPFTNIGQVRGIGSFPEATFELLKKHLSINGKVE